MTQRKRWPNHAENARIEAIAAAMRGQQATRSILSSGRDPETLRNAAYANESFLQVIINLAAVGPREINQPPLTHSEGRRVVDATNPIIPRKR